MTTLQALIVDDEPLARAKLRRLLADEPDVAVAGECASGEEAVAALRAGGVDLVFLDVQMPEKDGFEVVSAAGPPPLPVLIFVTAHEQHALRAFDADATDYLLKPFDRARLQRALGRARAQLERRAGAPAPRHGDRLVIRSAGKVAFLRPEEVDWIESAGNYVRLWAGGAAHLYRETMSGIEAKLDPRVFLRIHRTTIVNLDRVKELTPWFHGDYVVILRDGTRLNSSKGYRQRLQAILG